MRQSMNANSLRTDDKVLPASNYFGGTFYKTQSTATPIKMMATATNDQKTRVIRSNKREAWASIDANASKTVREKQNESAQIGLISTTTRDFF